MKEFTLPVWVVAAAKSATQLLLGKPFSSFEKICLPNEEQLSSVPISASALLDNGQKALGITHCESGLGLDLTRGLEVWTYVQFQSSSLTKKREFEDGFPDWLHLVGGEGLGKFADTGKTCISEFARQLIIDNLYPLLPTGSSIRVEVVFPKGESIANRTSNKAFGIIDGLALIGTQAEAKDSASPEQLKTCMNNVKKVCNDNTFDGSLIFVIGENGLDLAQRYSFPASKIIKAGNWLGPLIVSAANEGVQSLLLIGYHGKLIKLAGGIFHTHHHLADGRLEILISLAVKKDISLELIKLISTASSMEEALVLMEREDPEMVKKLWNKVAEEVERRSIEYVNRYFSSSIQIGALLFDRSRNFRWAGSTGMNQVSSLGLNIFA